MLTTLDSNLTDAEICRQRGWGPGTILQGSECGHIATIQITAVGRDSILATEIRDGVAGREGGWTLYCRDWQEVVYR